MDGECSEPCGDGIQIMTRTIVEVEDFGGLPCEGDSTLEAACFIEECPPALSGNTRILIANFKILLNT